MDENLYHLKKQSETKNYDEINVLKVRYFSFRKLVSYECDICKSRNCKSFGKWLTHFTKEHRPFLYYKKNNWAVFSLYRYVAKDAETMSLAELKKFYETRPAKGYIYLHINGETRFMCNLCDDSNFSVGENLLHHFQVEHKYAFDFSEEKCYMILNIKDEDNFKKNMLQRRPSREIRRERDLSPPPRERRMREAARRRELQARLSREHERRRSLSPRPHSERRLSPELINQRRTRSRSRSPTYVREMRQRYEEIRRRNLLDDTEIAGQPIYDERQLQRSSPRHLHSPVDTFNRRGALNETDYIRMQEERNNLDYGRIRGERFPEQDFHNNGRRLYEDERRGAHEIQNNLPLVRDVEDERLLRDIESQLLEARRRSQIEPKFSERDIMDARRLGQRDVERHLQIENENHRNKLETPRDSYASIEEREREMYMLEKTRQRNIGIARNEADISSIKLAMDKQLGYTSNQMNEREHPRNMYPPHSGGSAFDEQRSTPGLNRNNLQNDFQQYGRPSTNHPSFLETPRVSDAFNKTRDQFQSQSYSNYQKIHSEPFDKSKDFSISINNTSGNRNNYLPNKGFTNFLNEGPGPSNINRKIGMPGLNQNGQNSFLGVSSDHGILDREKQNNNKFIRSPPYHSKKSDESHFFRQQSDTRTLTKININEKLPTPTKKPFEKTDNAENPFKKDGIDKDLGRNKPRKKERQRIALENKQLHEENSIKEVINNPPRKSNRLEKNYGSKLLQAPKKRSEFFPDEKNIIIVGSINFVDNKSFDFQCCVCETQLNTFDIFMQHMQQSHQTLCLYIKGSIKIKLYLYSEDIRVGRQNYKRKIQARETVAEMRQKRRENLRETLDIENVIQPKIIDFHGDWIENAIIVYDYDESTFKFKCDMCFNDDLDSIENFMGHMLDIHKNCLSYRIREPDNSKFGNFIFAIDKTSSGSNHNEVNVKEEHDYDVEDDDEDGEEEDDDDDDDEEMNEMESNWKEQYQKLVQEAYQEKNSDKWEGEKSLSEMIGDDD